MAEPDITIHECAVAIRVSAEINEMLDPAIAATLARMMLAARDEIVEYASEASVETANVALVRIVGFLWDSTPTALNNAPQVNAMRMSGAMSLLSPWRTPQSEAAR